MTRPQITPEVVSALTRDVGRRGALVWVYLWSRADRDSGKAWPSGTTIARAIGTNRNHVVEDIKRLEAKGWLFATRLRGVTSQYVVAEPVSVAGLVGGEPVSVAGPPLYPPRDGTCIRGGTQNTTKNTTKNTKARNRVAEEAVTLPSELDTPEFRAVWSDWELYRAQKRDKLTPIGRNRQLAKLTRWGGARAIRALEHTMEQGWSGIFEPKDGNGKPKSEPAWDGAAEARKTTEDIKRQLGIS